MILFEHLVRGLSFWQKNVDVHYWEAECYRIDAENKKVYCRSNLAGDLNAKEEIIVDYDYLVTRSNTFNIPGVAENCHFLKVTRTGLTTFFSLAVYVVILWEIQLKI